MVSLDAEGLSKCLGRRGVITLIAGVFIAGIVARSMRDEEIRCTGVDLDPEILLHDQIRSWQQSQKCTSLTGGVPTVMLPIKYIIRHSQSSNRAYIPIQ